MDECVFADGEVTSAGQIIGIVVATTQPLAQRAAKAVRVTYQDLPSIITIKVGAPPPQGSGVPAWGLGLDSAQH